MVDEATGKKWYDFTATKSGMVEWTCKSMNTMKTRGVPILRIRVDPAGVNKALEKRAQSAAWQGLQPVKFEFTSRETPQHNNLAELLFSYSAVLAQAKYSARVTWKGSNQGYQVCGSVGWIASYQARVQSQYL